MKMDVRMRLGNHKDPLNLNLFTYVAMLRNAYLSLCR